MRMDGLTWEICRGCPLKTSFSGGPQPAVPNGKKLNASSALWISQNMGDGTKTIFQIKEKL